MLSNTLHSNVQLIVIATLFYRRVNSCLHAYSVMRKSYPQCIWRGYIPVDTKFRDASLKGLPVNAVASKCRGAFAYDKLTNDLMKDVA